MRGRFYLPNGLGSLRQLADANAEVYLARYYQPFGSVLRTEEAVSTAYGYTGEVTNANRLVYLRARHYAPTQGRFVSRDTWPGDVQMPLSLNRWNYVESNPINLKDPSGHSPIPPGFDGSGDIDPNALEIEPVPGQQSQNNFVDTLNRALNGPLANCGAGYTTFGVACVPAIVIEQLTSDCDQKQLPILQSKESHLSRQCQATLKKIKKALAEVQKRYDEWEKDLLDRRTPGHRKTYGVWQTKLRSALEQWNRYNCGELPSEQSDAWEWVTKPLP